jgi:hypothetical protein
MSEKKFTALDALLRRRVIEPPSVRLVQRILQKAAALQQVRTTSSVAPRSGDRRNHRR